MKVPFFFRTRNQLSDVENFLTELNESVRKKIGWSSAAWIHMTTQYTNKSPIYQNIPKKKPGEKKYMAVLHANREQMNRLNLDLERMLTKLGVELAPRNDKEPKYDGETTEAEFLFTSENQFLAAISTFDKGFGQGNWRMKGPKGMHNLVKRVQDFRDMGDAKPYLRSFIGKYENGVPVKIVVNEANIDMNKYLFKLKLKA